MIGAAVARRLLRDPAWEVRISDQRQAPDWMREGCEVNTGDLRSLTRAREAMEGCSHVVHLAAVTGGPDYRLLEVNNALYNAVVRAALDHDVERDRAIRRHPSVEKARRLLGWEARIDAREGLPATVAALREGAPI